jgi:hypothetical protein
VALDRPWNMNAIQKPLSGLKNVLQKPHGAFQEFWLPSFMQNLRQTHCSSLPAIADKMKHKVKKALV